MHTWVENVKCEVPVYRLFDRLLLTATNCNSPSSLLCSYWLLPKYHLCILRRNISTTFFSSCKIVHIDYCHLESHFKCEDISNDLSMQSNGEKIYTIFFCISNDDNPIRRQSLQIYKCGYDIFWKPIRGSLGLVACQDYRKVQHSSIPDSSSGTVSKRTWFIKLVRFFNIIFR